jgi:hypothetical protein
MSGIKVYETKRLFAATDPRLTTPYKCAFRKGKEYSDGGKKELIYMGPAIMDGTALDDFIWGVTGSTMISANGRLPTKRKGSIGKRITDFCREVCEFNCKYKRQE